MKFSKKKVKGGIEITGFEGKLPKKLTIPKEIEGEKVVSIGNWAFYKNQLTEVSIPKGCRIGSWAFQCNNLTEVTIGQGCSIGRWAFAYNKLTEVSIQKGCSIGRGAFYNNDLTEVDLFGKKEQVIMAEGYAMIVDGKKKMGNYVVYSCRYLSGIIQSCYVATKGAYDNEIIKQLL